MGSRPAGGRENPFNILHISGWARHWFRERKNFSTVLFNAHSNVLLRLMYSQMESLDKRSHSALDYS